MAYVGPSPRSPWGRRLPVTSGVVVGLAADILLDFVNNVYRVDGTTYATAALAGFTGTGTFNASGYTPSASSDRLIGAVNLPGDFIVFADFSTNNTGITRLLWEHRTVNFPSVVLTSGAINVGFTSSPTASRVSYGLSGGTEKASFDNATTVTGSGKSPQGSADLWIGGNGSTAWSAPIRKFAIYKQTLTDAQIQALT